jgi:hypothetical protein
MICDRNMIAIFDLETEDTIANSPGTTRDDKVRSLQFTCCSVLTFDIEDIKGCSSHSVLASDGGQMQTLWRSNQSDIEKLLQIFDNAKIIVGFNIFGFDFQVLRKHYRDKLKFHEHLCKSLDIFSRIRDVALFWPKLDTLLKCNGFQPKISNGIEAIRMYATGRLQELAAYCESDTRLCAQLAFMPSMNVYIQQVGNITIPGHVFNIQSCLKSKE